MVNPNEGGYNSRHNPKSRANYQRYNRLFKNSNPKFQVRQYKQPKMANSGKLHLDFSRLIDFIHLFDILKQHCLG